MRDPVYAEPYAGGAGAGLSLLYAEKVSRIVLNDKDRCIYAFWRAVLNQTEGFLDLLESTPVTIREWRRQRGIYQRPSRHGLLRLGFATFYLNRCNRSGILVTGGPIGGHDQQGKWKLDARFNRAALRERIEKVALFRDRIEMHKLDAVEFLRDVVRPITRCPQPCLVYLDPPYYAKGRDLYLNAYKHDDHAALGRFLGRTRFFQWVMTYDSVPEIHSIYATLPKREFELDYSAYERRSARELLIHDPRLSIPSGLP
jgi:DNA adenine methylase